MKKTILFCTMALMLCFVACNRTEEEIDVNQKSLAKHWIGDSTSVMFDVNGNVMTPDSFSTYLDEHKMIAALVGEKYLPYIKTMSTVEVTDLILKADYTYEMKAKANGSEKNVTGTWVEVNDVVTINVDLQNFVAIDRNVPALNFTVDYLTKTHIEISGTAEVLNAEVSGISAGAIITFKGHAAN